MKIGIDISMWHLKNTPTSTSSIIEAEDGTMHVDFRNSDFLSSIPTLASNKVVKQTLGNKNLEKPTTSAPCLNHKLEPPLLVLVNIITKLTISAFWSAVFEL